MEKDLMMIIVIIVLAVLLFGIIFRVMPLLFKPQSANQELRKQAIITRGQSKKIIEDAREQAKRFREQKPVMP